MRIVLAHVAMIIFLANCTSLSEAGRSYFLTKNYVGVEQPEKIFERLDKNQQVRRLIYPGLQEEQIIECTLLRNQVYVASLSKLSREDAAALKRITELLEHAYQRDDQAFLAACAQVWDLPIGRLFGEIQAEYLRMNY